jgi:hypothetical protein
MAMAGANYFVADTIVVGAVNKSSHARNSPLFCPLPPIVATQREKPENFDFG